MDVGENVFHRLEENCARLHHLLSGMHEAFGLEPVPAVSVMSSSSCIHPSVMTSAMNCAPPVGKRRRRSSTNQRKVKATNTSNKSFSEGTEQIMAASALCQLASPEDKVNIVNDLNHNQTRNKYSETDETLAASFLPRLQPFLPAQDTQQHTSNEQQYIGNGHYFSSDVRMS